MVAAPAGFEQSFCDRGAAAAALTVPVPPRSLRPISTRSTAAIADSGIDVLASSPSETGHRCSDAVSA